MPLITLDDCYGTHWYCLLLAVCIRILDIYGPSQWKSARRNGRVPVAMEECHNNKYFTKFRSGTAKSQLRRNSSSYSLLKDELCQKWP